MPNTDSGMIQDRQDALEASAQIVMAYVGNNNLPAAQLPELVHTVYRAITGLAAGPVMALPLPKPAVPIRRSVAQSYLICLEDGRRMKMLKRYLRQRYGLSPEAYRKRWGLPPDYPMVAPAYAAKRSALAKSHGLGRRGRHKGPAKRAGRSAGK